MVDAPSSNQGGRRDTIRNRNVTGASASAVTLKQSVLGKHKNTTKKGISNSKLKIGGYAAVFLFLVGVAAIGYQSPAPAQQVNQLNVANLVATDEPDDDQRPSVDEIVATDVAASLAEQANLPIASNLANMSVSLAVKSELAQSDDATISKPQIIQPGNVSREVQTYTAKSGESVDDVARQFGLAAETIRWANNLESDALRTGQKLTILPTNGVRHTFARGESVQELANRYKTSVARITSFNDLELSKPKIGQKLIIPNGILPATERPGYEAPTPTNFSYNSFGSSDSTILNPLLRASAGNRYAPGNCTWYAYERRQELGRSIGSFWGNANTWASNARAAGFTVNNTPKPGSVMANSTGYYGHVAIVESVKGNGDVVLSEMNYAGFNVVSSRTISAGQAAGYQYIH